MNKKIVLIMLLNCFHFTYTMSMFSYFCSCYSTRAVQPQQQSILAGGYRRKNNTNVNPRRIIPTSTRSQAARDKSESHFSAGSVKSMYPQAHHSSLRSIGSMENYDPEDFFKDIPTA